MKQTTITRSLMMLSTTFILAAITVACLMLVGVFEARAGGEGPFTEVIVDDPTLFTYITVAGEQHITGLDPATLADPADITFHIVIPDSINGLQVTEIAGSAFYPLAERGRISNVTFPLTIHTIGSSAFSHNRITNLVIPDNVTLIRSYAFYGNYLSSVTLSQNLLAVEAHSFSRNFLTTVSIPDSVSIIENSAFAYNIISSVTFGDSVQIIGASAFAYNSLTELAFPNSLDMISSFAFMRNDLRKVYLPRYLNTIGAFAFEGNSITEIIFPNYLAWIGSSAFANNNLTEVSLPIDITHISEQLFAHNNLTSVTFHGPVTYIGARAFTINNLPGISIPDTVTHIGQDAFRNNQMNQQIIIPESVTYIGSGAFQNNFLRVVKIPNNVTHVGHDAFAMTNSSNPAHTTVFVEHATLPNTWNTNWNPDDRIVVWDAVREPLITVSNPGGIITTNTLGLAGSGTSTMAGQTFWANEGSITFTHPNGIADIIINGQSLPSAQGRLNNNSAFWLGFFAANNPTSLILGIEKIGHDLDIQIISVPLTVTLNRGYGQGGTAWFNHNSGTTPDAITIPTRTGWAFLGYENNQGERIFNADGTANVTNWVVNEPTTLNAIWQRTLYEPTGLTFTLGGSIISWYAVDYASLYQININGHIFTISGLTTFFDIATQKHLLESYTTLTITVTAIGNNTGQNRTLDSTPSTELIIQADEINWQATQARTPRDMTIWWIVTGVGALGLMLLIIAIFMIRRKASENAPQPQN